LLKFTQSSTELTNFLEIQKSVSDNTYKKGLTKIIVNAGNGVNIPSYKTVFKIGVFLLPTMVGFVGTPDTTVIGFADTFASLFTMCSTLF